MEFALRAAVGSGMRRGEIVGLDVRDIDFEAGEIHVVHGTDSLGRQKDTKTAASKRALPMPASLKADLRERIAAIEEMFAETRKETGSPWPVLGDDTPLMCNELGERMRPHSVTRWWECHRDGYGCPGHDAARYEAQLPHGHGPQEDRPEGSPSARGPREVLHDHGHLHPCGHGPEARGGGGDGLVMKSRGRILSPFCFHLDSGKEKGQKLSSL